EQQPTEQEAGVAGDGSAEPTRPVSVQPVTDAGQGTPGPGLRAVQETSAAEPTEQAEGGGWWQPAATPQLWSTTPATDGPTGGTRLRAVAPDETATSHQSAQTASAQPPSVQTAEPTQTAEPAQSTESARAAAAEAAERARATWGAPELAPAPPEHWTQREISPELEEPESATVTDGQPDEKSTGWTLKLAPALPDDATDTTPASATEADSQAADERTADTQTAASEQAAAARTTDEQTTNQQATNQLAANEPATSQLAANEQAASRSATDGQAAGDGDADEQAASQRAADEQAASQRAADERAAELAADEAEAAGLLQPDWGSPSGDEQDQQAADVPAWGVEAQDDEDEQTPEKSAPLWTVPETTDTPREQPVQLWGDQPSQTSNVGQSAQAGQVWGSQQGTAGADAPADNGWGDHNGVQESSPWGQQSTGQQGGEQEWGGQSWPVQPAAAQQSGNGWGDNQQTAQQDSQPTQQQWGAGSHQGGDQAWGGQQTQRAWGDDGNEAWGGQADLSAGVGKRDGGKGKKKSKSSVGGGPFGGKMPLIIAGGVAVVLLIVAAVVLLTNGDKETADPDPNGTPTQSTSPTPTNQTSGKPGQSKNPTLHEGAGRIASDAISFPRRNPPWSDRKRLVQQLINSNGQRIVLKEDVVEGDDWSADIFVGGLGTASGFNGDPKATAAALSLKVRESMYGNIPVSYKTIANGPVKRTDKAGWVFQQSVTATTTAVTDRVLTLTVAVFDLGDGTAVAYISGIPNNRPDLKKAADQAYLGIQVG
ncbi:hypothetical protein ABZW60_24105, partial [Kribbella sp. NPDC003557]